MMDVVIIGAGRVGASLGHALRKKGYEIKALSCQRISSARESRKIIGSGRPLTDNVETAKSGNIVFLSLPDKTIEKVSQELSQAALDWSKKYVFHTSGLLGSSVLQNLKNKGAFTASLHPIQSFALKSADIKQFEGIYFGLEGCREALPLGKKMISQLKGQTLLLEEKDKPLYHTACSIASNFFVVLIEIATNLLDKIGLDEDSFQVLFPLVQGTLHNVNKFDINASLTGPIVRGDLDSIERHLHSLETSPEYRKIYTALASQALEMAKRKKSLTAEEIKALRHLLEEK